MRTKRSPFFEKSLPCGTHLGGNFGKDLFCGNFGGWLFCKIYHFGNRQEITVEIRKIWVKYKYSKYGRIFHQPGFEWNVPGKGEEAFPKLRFTTWSSLFPMVKQRVGYFTGWCFRLKYQQSKKSYWECIVHRGTSGKDAMSQTICIENNVK